MSMVRSLALPGALVIVAVVGAGAYIATRPTSPSPAPSLAASQTPAPAAVQTAAPATPVAKAEAEPPPAPVFVPGGNAAQPAAALPAANQSDMAPTSTQMAPTQTAPTQTGAIEAAPGAPPAAPATTAFNPVAKPYSLMRDSAAYVAASVDAPQLYPLKAGTAVGGIARSADDKWVIALTETGQAAFLPAVDLGPYDPRLSPAPDLPATVSGVTQVVDTANLVVNGQPVQLAGIKGEGGVYSAQLQSVINAQGSEVQCTLQGNTYLCTLKDGQDIARTALWNGAADLADDASDDYRAQAAAARAAHKGIWH